MAIRVRTLDANASLQDHETVIQQQEALGMCLLSIATGFASSSKANLVTFTFAPGAAPGAVTLQAVPSNLSDQQQQDLLNNSGKDVVCYGSLFVHGNAQNVAALR